MWQAPSRRARDIAYAGVLGTAAIGFLWVEHFHDLTFPIPWPDEGSFLWPALAFRDHASLYAPEVNPEREIFWMPPGFMVLEGIIFKVWSFSLHRARFLSALFLVGAMGCLAAQVRSSRVRFGHALLIVLVSFAPISQLVGNTARMESLLLLLATLGFLLLERRKAAGLGVLALALLVHPNAAFAFAGGLAYWLFAFRGMRRLSRADLATFAAVAALWLAYAFHLSRHWAEFVEDMTTQIHWKQTEAALNGTALSRLLEPFRVAVCAILVVVFGLGVRFRARVGAFCALALPLLVGSGIAVGWLYEVYAALGTLLVCMAALELVSELGTRLDRKAGVAITVAAAAVLGAGVLWIRTHAFLMASVQRATIPSRSDAMYCSSEERQHVEAFVRRAVRKDGPTVIQFLPDADSLLFHDMRSPSVRFLQQTYFATRPDVYILHDSPWFPQFLRDIELADFAIRNKVDLKLPDWPVVAKTTTGARWLAVQHEGPGRPWY
jgi:hypothetical protein